MFEDQKNLYGNCHIDGIRKAMVDFWMTAGEIREELGDRSYYLDEYLSIIFDCIGSASATNAAFLGEKKYLELLVVALSACGSGVDRKSNKFYDSIKRYIDEHPNNYLELDT